MPATSSQSLLRRVKQNDPSAWERLSNLYGPVVYQWGRQQYGLQPNDAADVMQDVFTSVMDHVDAIELGGSFRGWLWTVTRNKVRDHFRLCAERNAAAGGTANHDQLLQLPESPPETSSDVGQKETSGVHRRALELMKTDFETQTWQAFWRTTIDGASPTDVADELGISKWSVYKARSRVLQRLREEFADLM